jgi:iron complex transport system permease protein
MRTATARRISPFAWTISAVAVLLTLTLGVSIGAVSLAPLTIWSEISSNIFGTASSNSASESTIIWQLRLPRVLLAFVVGAMLASAGCAYQGTFRNPLADPYLLGVSAGAGLGATIAIFNGSGGSRFLLPLAAFAGAMGAVLLTYSLGRSAIAGRSSTALILAGVAVASLLTAIQTLLQQQNTDKIREIYAWVLGRLSTSGWNDLAIITPYILVCIVILLRYRRVLAI